MLNSFRGHFRTKHWFLYFNMPLESLQTDFSNKTYAIKKKIHTFFFRLRSSILKLMYLCIFQSPIFYLSCFSSPPNLLSNSIGLTWFWFFNTKLFTISHNDLIMDWFSRSNLYSVPHVIVSSFSSEIYIQETTFHLVSSNFYRIPIWLLERELWQFSQGHLFEMKLGSLKQSQIPQIIYPKIFWTKIWNLYTTFLRLSALLCRNLILWNFV